jgi:TonB family protein
LTQSATLINYIGVDIIGAWGKSRRPVKEVLSRAFSSRLRWQAGLILHDSESHRQSEPSAASRVAQTDTAKPNPPEGPSTKKSAPAPDSAAIAKWHKALLARLARYNRYPAQANSAEGVVSLAFTVDRKGNVVTSRIEKTSGSNVLDAEALALLARAAPLAAPPPEVADADLKFLLPVRFGAGEKH